MSPRKPQSPPTRNRFTLAFVVLCVVGVALSANLLQLHIAVHTDPNYESFCSVSAGMDCTTVALSKYSVVLGLPLAVWGLVAYAAVGILALLNLRAHRPSWAMPLAFVAAIGMSIGGVVLLAVSHFMVHSVCLVCAASYFVSFALVAVGYLALREGAGASPGFVGTNWRELKRHAGGVLLYGAAVAIVFAVLATGINPYWKQAVSKGPGGATIGVNSNGNSWIGATDPLLEIVEFSDYECPHCRTRHARMRKLVAEFSKTLRLVHRHFPLDNACNPAIPRPFHLSACVYARMTLCAQEQGKFWEANDYLYALHTTTNPVTVERLADGVGLDARVLATCVESAAVRDELAIDIDRGRALGITGTPTFVIGDRVFPGWVPPEEFKVLSAAGGFNTNTGSTIDLGPPADE